MSERSRWLLPVLLSMLFVYQAALRRIPTLGPGGDAQGCPHKHHGEWPTIPA